MERYFPLADQLPPLQVRILHYMMTMLMLFTRCLLEVFMWIISQWEARTIQQRSTVLIYLRMLMWMQLVQVFWTRVARLMNL